MPLRERSTTNGQVVTAASRAPEVKSSDPSSVWRQLSLVLRRRLTKATGYGFIVPDCSVIVRVSSRTFILYTLMYGFYHPRFEPTLKFEFFSITLYTLQVLNTNLIKTKQIKSKFKKKKKKKKNYHPFTLCIQFCIIYRSGYISKSLSVFILTANS